MGYTGFLFLALCFYTVLGGVPLDNRSEGRIVGGIDAKDGQFPYQVSIRNHYNKHFCGGSILNEFTILTSANCVSDSEPDTVHIIVGSIDIEKGTSYDIKEILQHPEFDRDTLKNDIAVLHIAGKIRMNNKVQAIKLIDRIVQNGDLIIAGWGRTSTNSNVPKVLQYVPAQLLPREECENRISLNEDTMCTVSGSKKGTCFGDNGSPLVLKGEGVVAVLSFTIGGCGKGYPDGYCNVFNHKEWIETNLFTS